MITLPWQVLVAGIITNGVVIVFLIRVINESRQMKEQERKELVNNVRKSMESSMGKGMDIFKMILHKSEEDPQPPPTKSEVVAAAKKILKDMKERT